MDHWHEMATFQARLEGILVGDPFEDTVEEKDEDSEKETQTVLSILHLQSAFILLLGGLLCGFLTFLGELFWNSRTKRRQNRVIYFNTRIARSFCNKIE